MAVVGGGAGEAEGKAEGRDHLFDAGNEKSRPNGTAHG